MIEQPNMVAAAEQAGVETIEAEDALDFIKSMAIASPAELKFAVGAVAEVKEKANIVDGKRKEIVDGLRAVIKTVDDLFRPPITALTEAEKIIKGKITGYVVGVETDRQEVLTKAGHAAAKGDTTIAADLIATAADLEIAKIPGMTLTRKTTFELTDTKAALAWCIENKRFDLLQINEKALAALVKADAVPAIPGLVVLPKVSVAITTSRVKR